MHWNHLTFLTMNSLVKSQQAYQF
uniref:Uncharacterized protein n=1 Tax=Arundo donax TaxID=35708 RepID=A0A0A9H964_ARUDO